MWINSIIGSSRESTNCGIMVKKKSTPQHSSDRTFAHEVGHNFGAHHDSSRHINFHQKYH